MTRGGAEMTAYSRTNTNKQSGVILIEALVAILIFSIGILALVGLQATAIKQSTDARYRTEAAALSNELIAEMWVSDRTTATLEANFESPGGPRYTAWANRVAAVLPGGIAPTVTIDAAGTAIPGRVLVTIQWRAPNEPAGAAAHNYRTSAVIQ